MQKKGNKYGTHRVIEPVGVLPQPANKLDNNMDEIWDNEILIDVQTLNIDSASFTDIYNYAVQQAGEGASDERILEEVKKEMFLNVELQGKHRNRRTGSGGMLLGKVEKIGDALKGKIDLQEGDRIATLVSLSLTPLRIDEIIEIRKDVDQVDIKGKAILFESGIYAKIPNDMPEKLALSALDVAGAPAQTAKLCQYGQNVVILGAGGKSGMLCCYEAKKRVGVTGKVIGLANSPKSTNRIKETISCTNSSLSGSSSRSLSITFVRASICKGSACPSLSTTSALISSRFSAVTGVFFLRFAGCSGLGFSGSPVSPSNTSLSTMSRAAIYRYLR